MISVQSLAAMSHGHRRLVAFLAGGIAAACLVGGGVAVASIPSTTTGNITGCVLKTTGAARIIDYQSGKRCKATETTLNWAQTGPQGTPGVAGPMGSPGTPGVSGWEIVTALTPIDTEPNKTVTAYCPPGKVVVGGGGFIGSNTGGYISSSFAQNSLGGVPGRAWAIYATRTDGASWRLVGQAVCVSAT